MCDTVTFFLIIDFGRRCMTPNWWSISDVHAYDCQHRLVRFFFLSVDILAGNGEAPSIGEIFGIVSGAILSITAIIGAIVGIIGIAKCMYEHHKLTALKVTILSRYSEWFSLVGLKGCSI